MKVVNGKETMRGPSTVLEQSWLTIIPKDAFCKYQNLLLNENRFYNFS